MENISPYYFSKLFKQEQEEFHRIPDTDQDETGLCLPPESDYSIKQICAMVGCSDPNYFGRIFKKYRASIPASTGTDGEWGREGLRTGLGLVKGKDRETIWGYVKRGTTRQYCLHIAHSPVLSPGGFRLRQDRGRGGRQRGAGGAGGTDWSQL